MVTLDTGSYPAILAELLAQTPLAPLGPGKPHHEFRDRLEAVSSAFAPGTDREMVAACRAGLWLAFNFLDESHAVSQEISSVAGSYWHALMHRREPDFSNSKYWFRRVPAHPVHGALCGAAANLTARTPQGASLVRQAEWNPLAFVDLCQVNYEETSPDHELCQQVQRIEWGLLFEYCYRLAVKA